MPHPDALRWNSRYLREAHRWLNQRPKQLLLDFAGQLPVRGLALDAAAGVAANGLFLAQRGLQVIAVDVSEVALRMAQTRFRQRGLSLDAVVCDLADFWLPPARFEVILNFNFLARSTFSLYRRALKPGGWLLFETFVRPPHPPKEADHSPEHYLYPGELLAAFRDFEVIHYGQREIVSSDGEVFRMSDQLVARKP